MINTDDFLAHHGVLGMHWGKRKAKASSRQVRSRKSKNVGSGIGAAAGVVGSQVAISAISSLMRNRTFQKFLVTQTLKKANLPPGMNLWTALVLDKVINANETVAQLISTPKFRATAALGSAYIGSVLGGVVGVRASDRAHQKSLRIANGN